MDMDIRGDKILPPKKTTVDVKNLPGFRASSELPEHAGVKASTTVTEDELAAAFETSDEPAVPTKLTNDTDTKTSDPTDLTLDREKQPEPENRPFEKPKKKPAKKKHIIILLFVLGVVVAGSAGWVVSQRLLDKNEQTGEVETSVATEKKVEEVPLIVPSPMTGRDVPPELAARGATAVMIENSFDARPQSGLLDADMVFEAVAEGGITRLIALYQESQPAHIGPIRSARPYYVDIARTFDAAYVHAGGSPDALARVAELGIKDMSAFENNGTYERVNNRDAPHDLYSSMPKLDARKIALGYITSTYATWKHKNDTPQTPKAATINFAISGVVFDPTFSYSAVSNSYLRSQNGGPHTDERTGAQLNPKVVIALVTSKGQDGQYATYRLTGSGDIRVFQDGIVSEGTWSKENATTQFVFKDKNGLEFNFNKGQAWVTLLDSVADITYTP